MTDNLIRKIADDTQFDADKCNLLFSVFKDALLENAKELNSVSIPGFATFSTEKIDERVINDSESGKQILCPPTIEMHLKSSVVLRKKILG